RARLVRRVAVGDADALAVDLRLERPAHRVLLAEAVGDDAAADEAHVRDRAADRVVDARLSPLLRARQHEAPAQPLVRVALLDLPSRPLLGAGLELGSGVLLLLLSLLFFLCARARYACGDEQHGDAESGGSP